MQATVNFFPEILYIPAIHTNYHGNHNYLPKFAFEGVYMMMTMMIIIMTMMMMTAHDFEHKMYHD